MGFASTAPGRRLLGLALTPVVACSVMMISGASAAADTPEPDPPGSSPDGAALNSLIDPALLESLQQSIVGLVVVWEEPEDPFALGDVPEPGGPAVPGAEPPVITICTGWFDTPTTIATAGHCVDPEQGRLAIDLQKGPSIDPGTGEPLPTPPVRPEPERVVYAFQPREMPGAVITSPVVVRVDSFRPGEEGDTAKLEMHGMPPGKPLAIAPTAPRLGETVTSIGFPGLNIDETDGVNLDALLSGGKTPAEVLQDSRLQPVNTSGTITARQFRNGVAVYQINADLAEGVSGGPTINSRGEVYGISSQMSVPFLGQNFNVITDTGMLREFLGHEPLQPGAASTNEDSRLASGSGPLGGGLQTGWIVFLSVLGGAVLGGLTMWLFARSTRRPSAGGGDESRPPPTAVRARDGADPPPGGG
ncbi:trypsin-like peptidase domain-containing protein [Pseudonocardia kunmingensis]|uniref:Trypsin-like peptidase n=1 Tax=Pseudonocardia kunmingensis TaxID=630975 RepID=A0A543DNC4_9PSEU|nr:trypsin-like peptidase domain-containing protein [Pseudonocardia kunmingensis]TQM10785.1 trypsin-like peptidase [Pseudonocardia kunmingensis]